ncbi:LuxR C-terminal-related transcriptional regulator [Streptomyces sp. TX20-6-3]|uniref:helix-turn-helix transcriptional regulator n=1 Tax=Streptomyces sp. TX20-6-3 TaxID=3028705 RepID=UPI0029A4F5EA|nr:LuxR C-terminal-related transcriptional regulator [Streptomyces sp. TX20-6-3]MDX2565405.1 LuxR C-terminal-related transcriptional regulator [Streptomyces sp. TX20-6-3]
MFLGQAGAGKSRLAAAALAKAAEEGWRSAHVTASKASAAVPLGAVASLIPHGVDFSNPVAGFAAVADALSESGGKRWAVLVDDLHLLDSASAVLLRQLMDSRAVRLIATIRSGEPLTDAAKALVSGDPVTRIDLGALAPEESMEVLRRGLRAPVERRTATELHGASGGNILYLREIVLGALTAGTLKNDGELWVMKSGVSANTPLLAELIQNRLAAAGHQALHPLRLLALCQPVSLTDLQQVADTSLLSEMEALGLIEVSLEGRRATATIAHPLYEEHIRMGMSGERQREILLQQVERTRLAGMRRGDDLLRVTAWELAATGTTDPRLLIQAATVARHSHDYYHAVALLEALPENDRTTVSRILHGESLMEVGLPEQAESILSNAYTIAESESDRVAITMIRTLNLFWGAADVKEALDVNEEAIQHMAGESGRRLLRFNEGAMRAVSGDPVRAVMLLDDLEHELDNASDVNIWLYGAMMKTVALALSGKIDDALAWGRHAYAAHVEANDRTLVSHPAAQLNSLIIPLVESGAIGEARRVGEEAFASLVRARASQPRVWMAFHTARAEWTAGHMEAARSWFAEAVSVSRELPAPLAARVSLCGLAASAAILGDLSAAQAAWDESRSYPVMGLLQHEESLADAWIHAQQGYAEQAQDILKVSVGRAKQEGAITSEAMLLTDIARLGGATAEVADRLREIAQVIPGPLALGRALLVEGLAEDDPVRLLRAVDELDRAGADLLAAEAASAASVVWLRNGESRYAAAASHRAATYLSRCPGVRTPIIQRAQPARMLTEREKEIAWLASSGMPSKAIAERLVVSVRTIDNHLQRIYLKLGVSNRRDLSELLTLEKKPKLLYGDGNP